VNDVAGSVMGRAAPPGRSRPALLPSIVPEATAQDNRVWNDYRTISHDIDVIFVYRVKNTREYRGSFRQRKVMKDQAAGVVELIGPLSRRRGRRDGGGAMHELGITQGVIDQARAAARVNGAPRVTDLYVTMTAAADFSQDSIEMYFAMLAGEDEMFRGATLHFDRKPIAATCLSCSDEFSTDELQPVCPQCGSRRVVLDPDAPMIQLTDVGIDDGTEG
jgi:Zn finger protein HypA/HybF involved in hydrogenase expression